MIHRKPLLALALISSTAALAAPTKPTPLREPTVTVYTSDQKSMDSDACHFYRATLYATSNPATRERELADITSDAKLHDLVAAVKSAAKNLTVKKAVASLEAKRSDLFGRVVFTVAKFSSHGGSFNYGLRIGYILGGSAADSIPALYVKCEGAAPGGGYRYNHSSGPFDDGFLNHNVATGNAIGDVISGVYEYLPAEGITGAVDSILTKLRSLKAKLPSRDDELSTIGHSMDREQI